MLQNPINLAEKSEKVMLSFLNQLRILIQLAEGLLASLIKYVLLPRFVQNFYAFTSICTLFSFL